MLLNETTVSNMWEIAAIDTIFDLFNTGGLTSQRFNDYAFRYRLARI